MRILRNTLLLLLAALMLSGCWWDDYSWRQKLTVELETPEGAKSASSVTRVYVDVTNSPFVSPEARGARSRVTGEAVVLEITPGKYLFALLTEDKGLDTAHLTQVFVDHPDFKPVGGYKGASLENLWPLRRKNGTTMEVPPKDYPLLVTFTDINDPSSVKQVDPDDLAASFCASVSTSADATVHGRKHPATEGGDQPDAASKNEPCVKLKRITLTITDEPVTLGTIENALEWIYSATYLVPPEQQPRLARDQTTEQDVTPSDFVDLQTWAERHKERK